MNTKSNNPDLGAVECDGCGGFAAVRQQKTGKKYFTPSKEHPYAVHFLGTNKIYKAFSITEKKRGFFRIIMVNKKYTLLAREVISFSEEFKPKAGYNIYNPPTYKREKDKYYVNFNNNESVSISIKRANFIKLFGTNSNAIKKFIKKKKLNIKKSKDLIQIFNYYNTL